MIDIEQFKAVVIAPAMEVLGAPYDSPAARELLLGTALQESRLTYLVQLDGDEDPYDLAIGVFQMERATHADIWANWLMSKRSLINRLTQRAPEMVGYRTKPEALAYNLRYAAVMCRLHYYRRPEPLPAAGDIRAQAQYWKEHYNTMLGHGTAQQYRDTWEWLIDGEPQGG